MCLRIALSVTPSSLAVWLKLVTFTLLINSSTVGHIIFVCFLLFAAQLLHLKFIRETFLLKHVWHKKLCNGFFSFLPRHVSVCAWQLQQSTLRLLSSLCSLFPSMWSNSNGIGFPCHSVNWQFSHLCSFSPCFISLSRSLCVVMLQCRNGLRIALKMRREATPLWVRIPPAASYSIFHGRSF